MTESKSNYIENDNQIVDQNMKELSSHLESTNATSEDITHLLYKSKDTEVTIAFMKEFDFKGMEFLDAFRQFIKKVDVFGDGGQICILATKFCKRYLDCNEAIYSLDQYETILLRIFVLNTSLTQKKGNPVPINVNTFISSFKNDDGICEYDERYLSYLFKSLKRNPLVAPAVNKRPRTVSSKNKVVQHFGSGFLSRKVLKTTTSSILNKALTWKKYFASLDDLSLSLYKYEDIKKYLNKNSDRISTLNCMMKDTKFAMFMRNQIPVEVMKMDQCLAKSIVDHDSKFILYLNDQSKYCFKVPQSEYVEFWNSTINYSAALLSLPRQIHSNIDELCYRTKFFSEGFTALNIIDQLDSHYKQLKELEEQKKYLEDVVEKPEDYTIRHKKAIYQIERYETYIRHLKITILQQQQPSHNPQLQLLPGCIIDDSNLDEEYNSLNTYNSLCGVSNTSSKASIIIETKSKKPKIGSPIKKSANQSD